ncbi:MAG: hypothetical protein JSR77_10235 [Planctomycetes bacterium]|nr:hypothetical protein [Planctomycetota bacterium]
MHLSRTRSCNAARLIAGGVVMASLLACEEPREDLVTVESETQAIQIQTGLEARGITQPTKRASSKGTRAGWVISVPAASGATARAALAELGLPRESQAGYESLSTGLVPSAAQERAMLAHAAAGELAKALEVLEGVVAARVLVTLPEAPPIDSPASDVAPSGSAAVFVKYRPVAQPATVAIGSEAAVAKDTESADAPMSVGAIRALAVRSIPGLDPARVGVVLSRAAASAPPTPGTGAPLDAESKNRMRLWLAVLGVGVSALLTYGFIAARQFVRARLGRAA